MSTALQNVVHFFWGGVHPVAYKSWHVLLQQAAASISQECWGGVNRVSGQVQDDGDERNDGDDAIS